MNEIDSLFNLLRKALLIKPIKKESCKPVKLIKWLENLVKNLINLLYSLIKLTALLGIIVILFFVIIQVVSSISVYCQKSLMFI